MNLKTKENTHLYEGISSKLLRIDTKGFEKIQLLENPQIHITEEIVQLIENLPSQSMVTSIDFVKIDFADIQYDSEIFRKSNATAFSFETFVILLDMMIKEEESNRVLCTLFNSGTRSEPPTNIFIVEHNGQLMTFMFYQDKNSDGNTFLHWYLSFHQMGRIKLYPSSCVMFACGA